MWEGRRSMSASSALCFRIRFFFHLHSFFMMFGAHCNEEPGVGESGRSGTPLRMIVASQATHVA